MKKIILIGILLLPLGAFLTACHKDSASETGKSKISVYYTCPMHHQIHEDHPGNCPICGMSLVPVYEEPQSSLTPSPAEKREEGGAAVLISPERQQLIGVKTALVSQKEISRSIHTSGRLIPLENKTVIEAALYSDEISGVKPGMKATVEAVSGDRVMGTVKEVHAAIDPITHLGMVAIEIPQNIPPSDFFNITIQVPMGKYLTIPKSALIDTGTRKTAFVLSDQNRFQARDILTDIQTDDDVVVTGGVKEGEKVVTQAAFLIDSESQLKAAVTGMSHD